MRTKFVASFLFAFLFTLTLSLSFSARVFAQTTTQTVADLTPTPVPLKEGDPCNPDDQINSDLVCPLETECASLDEASPNTCISVEALLSQTSQVGDGSTLPCSKWVYAYPTNNPDFKLNATPIPVSDPHFADPKFKTKRCIEMQTAIGLISTEPQGFIKSIFSIVLGLSGGIALIMIMISGYKFLVSQGNPEGIKSAVEGLTSATIGLLFIIFAFVILQIIGVDILRIPGFK